MGARRRWPTWPVHRSEQAQSLTEFAFIVPILLLIFLAITDYSRFMYFNQVINSAARAGGETAINHCAYHASCGMTDTPVSDDFVAQAVYCDASPHVQIQPAVSTCASCLTTSCNSPTSICSAGCLAQICVKDICIDPLGASRANGTDVTVTVGYSWKPITPLIDRFFPDKPCWASDSLTNHHTLCAYSTGNVS
jgi:Flp pilus assembly protein TadG